MLKLYLHVDKYISLCIVLKSNKFKLKNMMNPTANITIDVLFYI